MPIASAVGAQQKGIIMEKVNILRVDIRDNEEFDGDTLLCSYYLANPDIQQLKKVKNEIESRFKNEYENGEPLYQSISEIEAKLKKYFTLIEIRNIEIMW